MKYLKTYEKKIHQELQYAIIDNDLDKVKSLIKMGADLDKKGEEHKLRMSAKKYNL